MSKIKYTNKTSINVNPGIPEANKITDTNMNEIKTSVNELYDGWNTLSGSFSYSSADASVKTYVITTSVDLSAEIPLGSRIKIVQGITTKFFILTAINSNSMTLFGGTDYSLTNSTINSIASSVAKCPVGFPLDIEKWTVKIEITTANQATQTNPTASTNYNLGGLYLDVPTGEWNLKSRLNPYVVRTAAGTCEMYVSLNENITSTNTTLWVGLIFSASCTNVMNCDYNEYKISLTTKKKYYLMARTTAGVSSISLYHAADGLAYGTGFVRAECAYI